MAIYVRGFNPVWLFDDLTAHILDDNYWIFFLENTIPYIPATVYTTNSGIPWTNPIQLLANGTMPVDVFFDPAVVYRIEIRQGNTQSDPLIYLVENYSPGSGGSPVPPVNNTTILTDNQITNPQFSLISFESPYEQINITDPDDIEVAPGWFLHLEGTGNVTLERIALTSTLANPTNSPYALRITINGTWSADPYLYQRFNQNGMLWSTFITNRYVSSSVTARVQEFTENISAQLYDSMDNALTTVLPSTAVNSTFNEYMNHGLMPATTNTDTPPDAYIEYRLFLPTTVDIYLSSFQLVSSNSINDFAYIQDSIERQQDYTFHYYRDSLLRQQKESILTGWDFGLNPWQFHDTAATNLATFGYTADQTIMVQQAYVASATGNNISTARGTAVQNYGFKVTSVTATNQFAMIQYIDPATIRPDWGKIFSSFVKLTAQLQNDALTLVVKMRLIYRSSLPSTLAQAEPIATWAASGEPVYAAGWTAVEPQNDPEYNIVNGVNELLFEGFELPASDNDDMTLGIVIYTVDSMLSSGTPDFIMFNKVSLVQNDFAIDVSSLTFDETLRRCEFYYQKSFLPGTVPATNVGADTGESLSLQGNIQNSVGSIGPVVRFQVSMRATPVIILYNPSAANNEIRNYSIGSNWSLSVGTHITLQGFAARGTTPNASSIGNGATVHWTADARLGS